MTLAFVALGEQSIVSGLLYMIAQFAGAFMGSLILWGCTFSLTDICKTVDSVVSGVCRNSVSPDGTYGPPFGLGLNSVGPRVNTGAAFLLEIVGTYLLVITVMNSAVHKKSGAGNAAPIAIGWSVMLAHIVLIPYTGCGINPARSFGPMMVDSIGGLAGNVWVRGWWVYYTAPFVGSLLAAFTYKFIFEEPEEKAEEPESKKDEENVDA